MNFAMTGSSAVKCQVRRLSNIYKEKYQYSCFEPPGFGDRATVVIIPGALQDSKKHEYIGFRLACEGIRAVFAPIGLLRRDISESFDETVIDAMSFVDHIRGKHGKVQSIAGHSIGGLIAMRMALLDSNSKYQAFSPFLGLSICPSAVIAHKLHSFW
jgi:alpha-beta hydrolase superfamily lysophospholipase